MRGLARAASSIRHLCSLGLPSEALVPHFLSALSEVISSDSHHFTWTDKAGAPRDYFSNITGGEKYFPILLEGSDYIQIELPGRSVTFPQMMREEIVLAGQGDSRKRYRESFLYREVLQYVGGEYILSASARDATGILGCACLHRKGGVEFSPREGIFLRSVMPYLSYGLNRESGDDAQLVEDENRGIAILDGEGRIVQLDERAERLLFLVSWPGFAHLKRLEDFTSPVRNMCRNLVNMFEGRPGGPPHQYHRNRWGGFGFRAHWLQQPEGKSQGMVAVVISHHIPRRLKLWQKIHTLKLSPRQQEVCLLFAEGYSLTRIADQLGISRHTAIDHVRKLYERLGIDSDRDTLRDYLLEGGRPLENIG